MALGIPQLITRNLEDYEDVARTLASQLSQNGISAARLRADVENARTRSNLFDMQARAQGLERGIYMVWELFRARGDARWHANVVVA